MRAHPKCLYCGGNIPRLQSSTNIRTQEQADRGIGGRDWLTVDRLPQTTEELKRLTNHPWIGKIYRAVSGQSAVGINCFNSWDGETFAARHGFFCKIDCAARFGCELAKRGARLP